MISDLQLAELLCTRLCHELTGPIGAANNGAEFLADNEDYKDDPAIELISSSAHEAVARLQFYRQALGRINYDGEANVGEIRDLARDFFSRSRVRLNWSDQYTDSLGISVSRRMGRLICNLLIISAETLVKGGALAVEITKESEESYTVFLTASGEGVRMEEEAKQALELKSEEDTIAPRHIQALFAGKLAAELDAALAVEESDGSCRIALQRKSKAA